MNLKKEYIEDIKKSVKGILKKMGLDIEDIVIESPPQREFGDIALPMFKYAGLLKMKPFDIANSIKIELEKNSLIEKIDIKGAYLNLFFNRKKVAGDILNEIFRENENFGRQENKNLKIIVEFSCPNTNKPLHLGHCRNNVIGDAISRILKFNGYEVTKFNLINDRGIHICKSMLAYKLFGNNTTPENENKKSDHLVGDYYVRYAKEVETNKSLEGEAQKLLLLWEENDKETVELWKKMNTWAINGILKTYERMGIEFDVFEYESVNYLYGKDIVKAGLEKKVFYEESDGSIWINNEDVGLDKKAVLRKDGTSIYITQDIGTAVKRQEKFGFDRLVYVVGSEQIYHFKTLFAILDKLGFKWAKDCFHLSYGMVNLPEGKMKSREGKVVDADNLMDLLYDMAKDAVDEKNGDLSEPDKEYIANKISLSALKYYLLNFSTIKDVTFNPEKSISFDGNTGPYLQYATARINSLLRKADFKKDDIKNFDFQKYSFNADEWNIVSFLLEFGENVIKSADNYSPIEICNYLYELSRLYNKFYHDNPILNEEKDKQILRSALSFAVLTVLKNGLNLLGIEPLEKM